MSVRLMDEDKEDSGWTVVRSPGSEAAAKFFRLSQVRRLREAEQVAAVCYRVRRGNIEFLLVQTRSRRWTFPKGSVEPGLTHAQVAALEAFEEAGVHGRMEEVSFARYLRRKRGGAGHSGATRVEKGRSVNAHLCEVLRLGPPREPGRNRTWFSPAKAKRRLRDDRAPDDGAELACVVDRAVRRILRLYSTTSSAANLPAKDVPTRQAQAKDPLQKVHFEIFDPERIHLRIWQASSGTLKAYAHQVLRLGSGQEAELAARVDNAAPRIPRVEGGSGTPADAQQKITAIDHATTMPRARASLPGRKRL